MKKGMSFFLMLSIFVIFLGVCFSGCESTPSDASPYEFQTILSIPGVSQGEMYVRVNSAYVDLFSNAESVIQYSDKEAGIVKGKFSVSGIHSGSYVYKIYITITIEVKDEKCRVTFSDISYSRIGDVFTYYSFARGGDILFEGGDLVEEVQEELDTFVKEFTNKISLDASDW